MILGFLLIFSRPVIKIVYLWSHCGGGHFENDKFEGDRIIFQLGDSDFRILRGISYKNDIVFNFYS